MVVDLVVVVVVAVVVVLATVVGGIVVVTVEIGGILHAKGFCTKQASADQNPFEMETEIHNADERFPGCPGPQSVKSNGVVSNHDQRPGASSFVPAIQNPLSAPP